MNEAVVEKDLGYLGRESNKELGNFRLFGKSKHQQYFTPNEIAEVIFETLRTLFGDQDLVNVSVLDPTCGSGRLLAPWKKAGAQVLGIELDKETAAVAKRVAGKSNVRCGDILDYAEYLERFNVVVTNPPYGIWWNVEGKNISFESECYGNSVESQAATLEIATNALTWNGILAAVIPSTTFSNAKDSKTRNFLFKNYDFLLKASLRNVFKKEYGIDVVVDLVVAIKTHEPPRRQNFIQVEADLLNPGWKQAVIKAFTESAADRDYSPYPTSHGMVPFLDSLATIPVSNSVTITSRGIGGDVSAIALLDFLNNFLSAYNPVQGMETGIADAYLSKCALITRGVGDAREMLSLFGFEVVITPEDEARLKRLHKKYDELATPIYRPKPHQLLAYYYDREYKAAKNVSGSDGKLLFKKNRDYRVHPTWVRRREVVKLTTAYDESKKKDVTIQTEVDRGYLAFKVVTEQGEKMFQEIDVEEIRLFTDAFPLPEIRDVDDRLPAKVDSFRVAIERESPFLFDYQKEDLARLALKPFGYVGYEMGGGKTVSASAWAKAKGFKAVLVVCQSGLIGNWLNELNKFGFTAERLTTHSSVDKVKSLIEKGIGEPLFFVTSYEFISLDTGRRYDPWDCIEYDKDGNVRRSATQIKSHKCPVCHRAFENVVRQCPKCGDTEKWTGAVCNSCGYRAYTYTSERHTYPAYRRMKKLFDCVIVDEAQLAKTKNSDRGRAVRALKAEGKLILTGTLMKGYCTDTFWNIGWLLGFGNPLFPYNYRGGSKLFLNEFGTFEFVTKLFEDTLSEGQAKLIPEVSNLNRFWRILSSFTVRRLKDEMVELPEKKKQIILLEMDPAHAEIYNEYQEWASSRISKAMQQASENGGEVNMGVISSCLWKLRFAATVPVAKDYLCDGSGPDKCLTNGLRWNKLRKVLELVSEIKRKNEKVVIFSALRPMVSAIAKTLNSAGIKFMPITANSPTKKRFDLIDQFSHDTTLTAIVAGLNVLNRGFTITAAANVIITDIEYSPESVLQAEDRVHRTGQEKEVNVFYLFSKETIDEDMYELISKKQAAIANAIDGSARDHDVARLLESIGSNIQLEVAKRILNRPVLVIKKEEILPKTSEPVVYTPSTNKVVTEADLNLPQSKKSRKTHHPGQILMFSEF